MTRADGPGRWGETLHEMRLRAFDVSERAGRRGLASQRERVERWRAHLFLMAQMAFAAGLAWWVGRHLLDHTQPFFAVVAAILCLGLSFGQRLTRVVEVAVGVLVGVVVGDLVVLVLGTGAWQVALVVFVAMSVALWLGARTLMVMQAGIQAATVVTLLREPGQGLSRWLDALVGCGIALAFALVAPTTPVQKPRLKAAKVLAEVAATLRQASAALASGDQGAADAVLDRARATEDTLAALSDAAAEGISLVRYSPFLREHRRHVQDIADLVGPLDRLSRNLRVLARRVTVVAWRGDEVPAGVLTVLREVADVVDFCASELSARRLPERARDRVVRVGDHTAVLDVHDESLSTAVVLGQVRSMLVDLLELTGLSYADARALIPDMH